MEKIAVPPVSLLNEAGPRKLFSSQGYICLLGALLNTAGSGIFYVMPVYSDAVSARLHMSGSAIGWIDSLETASLAVAAIAMSMAARWLTPRMMILCCLIACAGNLMVGLMPNALSLGVLRVVTGLFGEGPLCAYGYIVLGKMRRPERGFGVSLTLVALVSAIAMRYPIRGLWTGQGDSLILLGLLALPVAFLLLGAPRSISGQPLVPEVKQPTMTFGDSASMWPIAGVLMTQGLWAAAPGLLWPFATQIAQQGGALAKNIDSGIALSPLVGLLGSAVPIAAGKLVSHRLGALLATAGLSAAALLLPFAKTAAAIAACLGGFIVFWNLAQVYQPAIVASIDRNGRGMAIVPAVQLVGMAGGTAIAGLLVDRFGFGEIPWICAAVAILATPAFLIRMPTFD